MNIGDSIIKVAVIYGTANAAQFLDGDISDYHFIEVMTCPGGCISGAGQPQMHTIPVTDDIRKSRIKSMYSEDERMTLRNSTDNPEIARVYSEFYGKPLGELSHRLLHTGYNRR